MTSASSATPELSIVVLSWNTKDLLAACLRSLSALGDDEPSFEVIVVDNASSDGSADMVARDFPRARLLRNPRNDGYAIGNNLGAEYCAKNQDPACPAGSFVGPDAILNPNGDGTWVPCEGTICTNPNHGAGTPEPSAAPAEVPVEGAPCEGSGHWVHLTGGDAAHYGTEWLCARPSG